jgi:sulfide:quinone oxidoreductase
VTDADGKVADVEKRFDMIHVVPPQTGLDVVRASPLSNAAGWIEVDPANLRHVRYPNIFALGDAASTPNAKTAAAVRIQAPIVVANLLAAMKGEPLPKALATGPALSPSPMARSCSPNSPIAAR